MNLESGLVHVSIARNTRLFLLHLIVGLFRRLPRDFVEK